MPVAKNTSPNKGKRLAILLGAVLLFILITFAADFVRVFQQHQRPLFAMPLQVADEEKGDGVYYGLGYTLQLDMDGSGDRVQSAVLSLFGQKVKEY